MHRHTLSQMHREPITFSPLERSHLPLVAGWLAEPLVARWWNHDTSPEAVEADFAGVGRLRNTVGPRRVLAPQRAVGRLGIGDDGAA